MSRTLTAPPHRRHDHNWSIRTRPLAFSYWYCHVVKVSLPWSRWLTFENRLARYDRHETASPLLATNILAPLT